ncbi:hypothetical protein GOP47_0019115 [Adiantum capillus-veneris]|uniref:CCHC-type domain-containing protein n=1 Tax=Adiantum capillus-veneris TaxID=13818 RepID=A0A9D4ZBC0_ADICA|nr:hypothetical protein GOP47_0019115 [Adiantum capillus-veneris]
MNQSRNQPIVQPVRVNALPVTQDGRQILCVECQEWGHKKADCPWRSRNPDPHYQNQGPQRQPPANRNQARNPRNPGPVIQRPNPPPTRVTSSHVTIMDEVEEQA